MKTCTKCGVEYTNITENFYCDRSTKDGFCRRCKNCMKMQYHDYYSENPEKHRERSLEWHRNNPEKSRNKIKTWHKNNPDRSKHNHLKSHLKNLYGLSIDEYNKMITEQNNQCAICGKEMLGYRNCNVDHNHETGKVRGLLCSDCNIGLGQFKDNSDILILAARYLKENS